MCRDNPKAGTNIIAEYIKYFNRLVEKRDIRPNTVPGYPKPIKVLLDTNDVPLYWKRLYHLYPRLVNSKDRAYTREELQKMMMAARDITDKVILAMFSYAGFRLESWDYFTWRDVIFFKDKEDLFWGAALLVYRGDPESYWTFITPEACNYLVQYREKWRKDFGAYPESETKPQTESEPETKPDSKPTVIQTPETEPEPVPETDLESVPEPVPEMDPEPASEMDPEPESVMDPELESVPEMDLEPAHLLMREASSIGLSDGLHPCLANRLSECSRNKMDDSKHAKQAGSEQICPQIRHGFPVRFFMPVGSTISTEILTL